MHSATALNSLLVPVSFPQGSFSPLNGCFGSQWWDGSMGWTCSSFTSQLSMAEGARPVLKSEDTAPAALLLEVVLFLIEYFVT